MKFTIISVLLALAPATLATPTVQSRAITGPTRAYTCDVNGKDVSFSASYVTSAITSAAKTKEVVDMLKVLPKCDLSSSHARDLAFCQPKDFQNYGTLHFPNCLTGPWYEFPLITDGKTIYTPPKAAGPGNPARVIFQYSSSTTAKFCGMVVHSASVSGDFVSCN